MAILPQPRPPFVGRRTLGTTSATELARLLSGDLLLLIYDWGFTAGSGQPLARPRDPTLAALLDTLRERQRVETLRMMELSDRDDPLLAFDDIPGWLLAHAERQVLPIEGPSPL